MERLSVFSGKSTNLNSPLFGYNVDTGEGAPADVRALFALAPNSDWYGVGDYVSATKSSLQDCANYAVQNSGDGFVYHGERGLSQHHHHDIIFTMNITLFFAIAR
jgi:hypothetical protein